MEGSGIRRMQVQVGCGEEANKGGGGGAWYVMGVVAMGPCTCHTQAAAPPIPTPRHCDTPPRHHHSADGTPYPLDEYEPHPPKDCITCPSTVTLVPDSAATACVITCMLGRPSVSVSICLCGGYGRFVAMLVPMPNSATRHGAAHSRACRPHTPLDRRSPSTPTPPGPKLDVR